MSAEHDQLARAQRSRSLVCSLRENGMRPEGAKLARNPGRQSREEREAVRRLEHTTPGAPTVFEVAWYACDGRRTLGEIAALVELETGHAVGDAIIEFFEWAARRGLLSSTV